MPTQLGYGQLIFILASFKDQDMCIMGAHPYVYQATIDFCDKDPDFNSNENSNKFQA